MNLDVIAALALVVVLTLLGLALWRPLVGRAQAPWRRVVRLGVVLLVARGTRRLRRLSAHERAVRAAPRPSGSQRDDRREGRGADLRRRAGRPLCRHRARRSRQVSGAGRRSSSSARPLGRTIWRCARSSPRARRSATTASPTAASCSCRPDGRPRGGVDGPRDPLRGVSRSHPLPSPVRQASPLGALLPVAARAHDGDVEPRARLGEPRSPTIRRRWQRTWRTTCAPARSCCCTCGPAALGVSRRRCRSSSRRLTTQGLPCRHGLGDAQRDCDRAARAAPSPALVLDELVERPPAGRRPVLVGIPERRERDGLDVVREAEHLAHGGGVEGGDPAGAEPRAVAASTRWSMAIVASTSS